MKQITEILKLIRDQFVFFIHQKLGIVILSSIFLILIWGYHGNLDLLKIFIVTWQFPLEDDTKRIIFSNAVPWGSEIISFWSGAFLLVLIPVLIIRLGFRQSLSFYGLGLPPREKRKAAWLIFLIFMLVTSVSMFFAARNSDMQTVYPFYKSFKSSFQFFFYELCYFPFFLAIEFMFRGYLLFGTADNPVSSSLNGKSEKFYLRSFGIIIPMLSYNTWHLGKPLTELWATPVWGIAAGVVTYYLKSIWPVLMVHFIMNVLLDAFILYNLNLLFH